MPIYGYTCQDCQHHFEVIRPVSQAEVRPPACEQCHSHHTARELGMVMAIFGSGANRRVVGGNSCGSCTSSSPSTCAGCKPNR